MTTTNAIMERYLETMLDGDVDAWDDEDSALCYNQATALCRGQTVLTRVVPDPKRPGATVTYACTITTGRRIADLVL